jgi:hypothetical protein
MVLAVDILEKSGMSLLAYWLSSYATQPGRVLNVPHPHNSPLITHGTIPYFHQLRKMRLERGRDL